MQERACMFVALVPTRCHKWQANLQRFRANRWRYKQCSPNCVLCNSTKIFYLWKSHIKSEKGTPNLYLKYLKIGYNPLNTQTAAGHTVVSGSIVSFDSSLKFENLTNNRVVKAWMDCDSSISLTNSAV